MKITGTILGYIMVLFRLRFWYLMIMKIMPAKAIIEEKDRTIKYGQWETISICDKCDKQLSDEEIYQSSNTCPYCGHHSKIMCDYKPITLRIVNIPTLDGISSSYEGRDDKDKAWVMEDKGYSYDEYQS